jgi:hypothetical protein
MPTATLEELVPEHRDTDAWRDGLNDEATIMAGDLRYPYAVEVLERVQLLSNTFFAIPEQFSQDDVDSLAWAAHLLQGETVTGTWKEAALTLTPTADGLEVLEREINDKPLIIAQEQTLLIGQNGLPLGSIATHLLSVRVEHWDGIDNNGNGRLVITPGSTDEYESWRITGGDTAVDRAIPGVSRKFRHQVTEFMDQNDELLRRLAQ